MEEEKKMAEKIIVIKSKKLNENLRKNLVEYYCFFNDYQCVLELEVNSLEKELKSILKILHKRNISKLVFLDFCDFGDDTIILDILEKLSLKGIEIEIILQNIKTKKSTLTEVLNAISNYHCLNDLEVSGNV
jgi:hypothetical protein